MKQTENKIFPRSLLAASLALAACAYGSAAQAEDGLRLRIWISPDKGYNGLQKVGDAFTAQSGVPVIVEYPDKTTEKFQQAAGTGTGPDIFCWAHDRLGEFARSGLIVPVKPGKRIRDEIEDSTWQAFRYQGKTWGYPISIEAIGLIYNKALVKTPPASFDEVIKLDSALAPMGKKAILWDYNNSYFTWPLLAGAGGYIYGRDAKGEFDAHRTGVNTPGAVKAAEMLAGLINNGQMPRGATYPVMEAAFNKGELAMMISGPWAWENAKRSKIDFGVAPIPGVDGHAAKPIVGVLGCMIAAPSKVKDIAREFIENHLLRVESLKTINADKPLGVPADKAFYRELAADSNIRATMENARRGEAAPNIPEASKFWAAMQTAFEQITNGRQLPKEALDAASARILAK